MQVPEADILNFKITTCMNQSGLNRTPDDFLHQAKIFKETKGDICLAHAHVLQ